MPTAARLPSATLSMMRRGPKTQSPSGRSTESAWPPHRDAGVVQFVLQLCDVLDAEVKNGGGQSRVRASVAEHLDEVARRPCAPGGNDRNRNRLGHLAH